MEEGTVEKCKYRQNSRGETGLRRRVRRGLISGRLRCRFLEIIKPERYA